MRASKSSSALKNLNLTDKNSHNQTALGEELRSREKTELQDSSKIISPNRELSTMTPLYACQELTSRKAEETRRWVRRVLNEWNNAVLNSII
jgi:hypothetical protein